MAPHGRMAGPMRKLTKEEKKINNKNLMKALKPYRLPIFISMIFIVTSTVLSIYAPQILSDLTNEMANNAPTRSIDLNLIKKLGFTLIGFYAGVAICTYLANFIMNEMTQKYSKRMRRELDEKINKLPLKYFDSHQYGDTLSIITNDVDTVSQSLQNGITMLISASFMLIGVLIAMFATCWQMALTALLTVPLMMIMLIIFTKIAVPQFKRRQKSLGILNGKIEENYSGHLVIKAFNASNTKNADFDNSNRELKRAMFAAQTAAGSMMPMMTFVSYFAYAAICVVGGILMNEGGIITFGTITAFLIYINLFQSPMSQLAQAMNNLQMAGASTSRIFEFLAEEEVMNEDGKPKLFEVENDKIKVEGFVDFKDVCFGYYPDKQIIFNFSANIKPGMKVAIVGPTGAGKTTIVNLLMRFYELNSGDILIDGKSIKEMSKTEIRDIFGMVLQDTWLFEGTIRDNIVFNKKNMTDEEIMNVCKEADLYHYVNSLPDKLDTVIKGDDSVSSGQRQLLTIARAMATNAPLLILDEATSNVDTRTEEVIQKAMDKLTEGRTSFVIAHRLSTIKNADMILVLKDGNIIEQGNHDELIKQDGFYASLYNSQFQNS